MAALMIPERVAVADVPGLPEALTRAGIMLPAEAARLDAIERSTYVLVRNDGDGERWRCGRCNVVHSHYTLMCIPRPFRGIREALYAHWRNAVVRDADLSPEQRQRRNAVGAAIGMDIPLLSDLHPETARALGTREGSTEYGAIVLGTIDPISPAKARQYGAQINAKARRPVVRL